MSSTYSDLKIELIGTGDQSGAWGTTTNVNLGTAIEQAITGSGDVTFADANVTLTLSNVNTSQIARNLRLNLIGVVTAPRNLILGTGCQIEKQYIINNTLTFDITVQNSIGGTSVVVPAGQSVMVFNTGANIEAAVTGPTGILVGTTTTQTLSNKRINPRINLVSPGATSITPDIASYDQYCVNGLATGTTFNAPIGTPLDGNKLLFRIVDNTTSKVLTWNAIYTPIGVALPPFTVPSKTLYVGCVYNAYFARWDVVAVITQV
jgi:hypothetical protein